MISAVSVRNRILGLFAIISFSVPAITAASTDNAKEADAERMGFVEWVVMKDTGLRMKARLDTGAMTSSLHATDVEEFEKDGEE